MTARAALLALLLLATPAAADTLTARIEHVHDGDTLTLAGGTHIRLHGIDAPELAQQCDGAGGERIPCGIRAGLLLRALVGRQVLACETVGRSWGRITATCRLPDGRDIGAAMVAAGYARDVPRYSRGAYAQAERQARERAAGLWAGRWMAPVEWRRRRAAPEIRAPP